MSFLLGTLLQSFKESCFKLFIRFKDILYKCLIFLLTSTIIVWLSVFLYGSFYYTYMPAVSHVKPVHLQFRSCTEKDGRCSFPSANVTLVKKGQDQLLIRGQQYKIYVDLEMPESPVNQNLGMFMIKLEFHSKQGELVHSSARSAILHYKSQLLQIMNILFFSPMFLMGSVEEKQYLTIELFDYYEEDPVRPAANVYVEVQSKNIEIYSAVLKIYAHFTGLRYLMFHWPVLSAIIGVGTNLFFLSIIALLSWYRYMVVPEKTQVVVKVGFEDSARRIEERRKQVKELFIREKQRKSGLRESGDASTPPMKRKDRFAAIRKMERTQSLDTLLVPRIHDEVSKSIQDNETKSEDSKTEDTELSEPRQYQRKTTASESEVEELIPSMIASDNDDIALRKRKFHGDDED